MTECPTVTIGDWVHVQLKWKGVKKGVSSVSGTIVEEDPRTMGFSQFKLDSGFWFSPESDKILEYRPNGQLQPEGTDC